MMQFERELAEDAAPPELEAALDRLDAELARQRDDFAPVRDIHERLRAQPGLEGRHAGAPRTPPAPAAPGAPGSPPACVAEEAALHAERIAALERRWAGAAARAQALRDAQASLRERAALLEAAARMRAELADARAWRAGAAPAPPSANRLIHLRNRLRALRRLRPAAQEHDARVIVLLERAPGRGREQLRAAGALAAELDELLGALARDEAAARAALAEKPDAGDEDDFESLQREIRAIESRVIVEHAMFAPADAMAARAAALTALRGELVRLRGRYEAAVRARRQRYEAGSARELDLRGSLEDLAARYGDAHVLLDQKIARLENGEPRPRPPRPPALPLRTQTAPRYRCRRHAGEGAGVRRGRTEELAGEGGEVRRRERARAGRRRGAAGGAAGRQQREFFFILLNTNVHRNGNLN